MTQVRRLVTVVILLVGIIGAAAATAFYYQGVLDNRVNSLTSQISDLQNQVNNLKNQNAGQPSHLRILGLAVSPSPASFGATVRLNFTISLQSTSLQTVWIDWGDSQGRDLVLNNTDGSMCATSSCAMPVGSLNLFHPVGSATLIPSGVCGAQPVGPGPEGSIIVFRPYADNLDYLVAHRVSQEVYPGVYRTEGDANPACDGWTVSTGQILGVYQNTQPTPVAGHAASLSDTHVYPTAQGVSSAVYTVKLTATAADGSTASATLKVQVSS